MNRTDIIWSSNRTVINQELILWTSQVFLTLNSILLYFIHQYIMLECRSNSNISCVIIPSILNKNFCSYQLNIWYVRQCPTHILNWFLAMGLKLALPWPQVVSVLHYNRVQPLPHSDKNIFILKTNQIKTIFSLRNICLHDSVFHMPDIENIHTTLPCKPAKSAFSYAYD